MDLLFFVFITLTDIVSTTKTIRYFVTEESDVGTKLGNLAKDLDVMQLNVKRNFKFIEQPLAYLFHLRAGDGQLAVAQRLDREQLCCRAQFCVLSLDVVDVYQDKSFLVHVEVDIGDINDNAPKFPVHEIHLEVLESAPVGTRFPVEVALDEDVGRNYIQSYTISKNNHFIVEVFTSEEEGGLYAELVLISELDREKEVACWLYITATDGGIPSLSGMLVVKVKVLDINDNSPVFENSFVRLTLYEDSKVGLLLLELRASDLDDGQNGEIKYGFGEKTPLEIRETFYIDPCSGQMFLAKQVDYENRQVYEFKIVAYDLGINSVPAQCTLKVDVLDVNDNEPIIIIKPQDTDRVTHLPESVAVNSFVALVSTTDRDSGENGHAHCSLFGHEHFRLQHAYGHTFMIVTASPLDRETLPGYNLTISATDHGSPALRTNVTMSIHLIDVNDNYPKFTKELHEVWIEENNPAGTFLMTIQASDIDEGQNGDILYSIQRIKCNSQAVSSHLVSIDPVLGSLYSTMEFDYEEMKDIEIQVVASDAGFPTRSKIATVWVRVKDVNDNAPTIVKPSIINGSAFCHIFRGATTVTPILHVIANDSDEGVNAKFTFDILHDPHDLFVIEETLGFIYLKRELNLSLASSELKVVVSVQDNGLPSLRSTFVVNFVVISKTGAIKATFSTTEYLGQFSARWLPVGVCVTVIGIGALVTLGALRRQRQGSYSTRSRMDKRRRHREHLETDLFSNACAPILLRRRTSTCHDTDYSSSPLTVFWEDSQTQIIMPGSCVLPVDAQPFDLHRKRRAQGVMARSAEDTRISSDPTHAGPAAAACGSNLSTRHLDAASGVIWDISN